MKKLLRTLFIIILLLWVWFMYIVKNPELPISQKILTTIGIDMSSNGKQKAIDPNCISYFDGCNTCMVSGGIIDGCTKIYCETPTEPSCIEYANTWIDLTNCISYFDGCNNCSVKDGKPDACTLMYCETPGQPKCNEYATGTAGLANPASTFCTEKWGKSSIVESAQGQLGMCELPDGTLCDERAYYRGECGTTDGSNDPVYNVDGNPDNDQPTACTMEYAPVCASVAVQCIKAPCNPVEQTFENKCQMNANKLATFVHDGECTGR